jgi:hypothetical protein
MRQNSDFCEVCEFPVCRTFVFDLVDIVTAWAGLDPVGMCAVALLNTKFYFALAELERVGRVI